MRNKLWLAVALGPALMASRCIHPVDVGVTPAPRTGDAPAFQFGYRGEPLTYVEEFQVADCQATGPERVTWRIVRDGQTPTDSEPLRITYGVLPRGYRQETPPRPLAPGGCYRASAVAMAPVGESLGPPSGGETFRLLPNGQVIVGEPGSIFGNTRPFRQLNRASVGCTRGWRRADTAADSAAVDAREYEVLDTRVSCGWLFTEWPGVVEDPVSTERATLTLAGLLAIYVSLGLLSEYIPDVPQ